MCPFLRLTRYLTTPIRIVVLTQRMYRDQGLGHNFTSALRAARRHA